jgi:hypothetical protein
VRRVQLLTAARVIAGGFGVVDDGGAFSREVNGRQGESESQGFGPRYQTLTRRAIDSALGCAADATFYDMHFAMCPAHTARDG